MKEIIIDTILDSLKLIPFLFIAFLIIELVEHKLSNKNKDLISKSGKFGPLFGSLLGLIPQCGFSVIATNLYVTRIISLGTLISIYLSTSDEMLPILLGHHVSSSLIIKILLTKFIIGMLFGFIIDFIFRKKAQIKLEIHEMCHDEECHCEEGIFKSSIIHTLKTILFILIASFIINLLFEKVGEQYLSKIFLKDSIFGPFVTSLIGLIPTCGSSIMITELYLNNAISFASLISGLLTGSGVAILVLFKSNKKLKENFFIILSIYEIGVIVGIIFHILNLFA